MPLLTAAAIFELNIRVKQMKLLETFIKKIEINHYTTRRSDAISFYNELCKVYKDTKFHFIHSGDVYYICGEIYVTKSTIKDHKYQIDYLAFHLDCTKYDVDSVFNEAENSVFIYRNVV